MNLSTSTIDTNLSAGRYCDGRNLYLTVNDNGAKSWVFIWKSGKTASGAAKRNELGLGSYTGAGRAFSLTLKQARLAADAVRMQLAAGIDPLVAKVQAKIASTTFGALMLEQIAILQKDWKGGDQAAEWTRSLTTHAAKLLPMSVDKISTDVVVSVLKPIWATIPVTAERVRYRIEQVMGLAISKTPSLGANPARYKGHIEKLVGKRPSKKGQDNHAALSHDAVPAVMAKLLGSTGMASKALAFLMLTATRTDEARLARVSEVDLDKALWTIPADRMKAGVEHIVPLSTQAVALLRSVIVEGAEFVFNGKNGALGATALSDKLCDSAAKGGLGFKGTATVHGMRSTFSDWVGDCTGFAKEDREFCLAHGLDAVEGAYRRSTAVEKRRAIMQAWADHATGVSNVVALKVAA